MAAKKMSDKHKFMAYLLNKDNDFGYTQKKIGELMGVEQPTICLAIKDAGHMIKNQNLQNALDAAKEEIADLKSLGHDPEYIDIDS